jgi:putative restriction endonuclease
VAGDNGGVRAYVGVTDRGWYQFLAARPELAEVNFWRPGGGQAFRALAPGEPFFFKSHYPDNKIVGGGFFTGFVQLRVSEAWNLLGPGNGAASLPGCTPRSAATERR